MPANTTPIFTAVPNCTGSTISAANTARDGSGSLVTAFTAGANGSLLNKITFTSSQATVGISSARVCRVFVTDTSDTNPKLRAEVILPAVTSSDVATGAVISVTFTDGLVIASGQKVKVSQSIWASAADNTDVIAEGGNY